MVNAQATTATDRRERPRAPAAGSPVLGQPKLNPFGDLHTVQHLSARLARGLKPVFEPMMARELRVWAEPLSVQRFADYRAERGEDLSAWIPMAMEGAGDGPALLVLDARFVLELLDLFFGGTGTVPSAMPAELSPAAIALVGRLARAIVLPLAQAWEPIARVGFAPGTPEIAPATLADADEAMVATRIGIAADKGRPAFLDILYAVAALKPHGPTLAGKVVEKAEPDAAWRHQLTRAVMDVTLPVRSVLAEPVVPLSTLVSLQVGDVIPISFGPDVPVMIGRQLIGAGTVGAANGQAAVRLTALAHSEGSPR